MISLHPESTWTRSVARLVQDQAERRPDGVALVEAGRTLTFRQLDERSTRLADQLRSLGVGPDVAVGLCMPSSVAMVVGALGILKAGGAYLPLDPTQPEERLRAIVRDAGVPVLVTDDHPVRWTAGSVERTVPLDGDGRWQGAPPATGAEVEVTPDDLAYVIYTSGSTGTPKGVEITHRSLLNLVAWHQRAFDVTPADRASQLAGVGFDAAVWEIWPYLTAGVPVHFAPASVRADPEALRDWLLEQEITITFTPTVMAERLLDLAWPDGAALRTMLTGGDALDRYPPPGLPFELVNNYGPTECTVVATSGPVDPGGDGDHPPTIGRPISNVQVHVLDEERREVPDGTPGELCIGGVSVARGYRNHPDLTAERFVTDPFSTDPAARLYRTGDLVRRLPGGDIAFVGRLDDQVKIRGYRIEPAEVAHALKRQPGVRDGVVVARERGGDGKQLVGYWVAAEGEVAPSAEELVWSLRAQLPDYMVPSALVRLDELPLTPNGKIDRLALPSPEEADLQASEEFVAPRTRVEREVAGILAPLLGLDRVSVEANFFLLGGHSLLGTQLIARLRDHFDIELSLRALFEAPTVAAIASEVERLILEKLDALDAAQEAAMPGAAVARHGGQG
jgi:amino acid adenylation domain-containing protein